MTGAKTTGARTAQAKPSTIKLREPSKKPYFVVGMAILLLIAMTSWFRSRWNIQVSAADMRLWHYVTGIVLVSMFAFQWALFFMRRSQDAAQIRRHYSWHKITGVAFLILFLFHAGTVGHGIMAFITLSLLVISITGLFNAETLFLTEKKARWLRLFLHYGLSAILVPIVLLHIWVALSYK